LTDAKSGERVYRTRDAVDVLNCCW